MSDEAGRYAIRVAGHLAERWGTRFEGISLSAQDDGTTVLSGPVADQSALHGLLRTLGDLGLPLISVTRTDDPSLTSPDPTPRSTS